MLQVLESQAKLFRDFNERLVAAWEFRIEQATAGRGQPMEHRIPSLIQPKHWNPQWKLHGGDSDPVIRKSTSGPCANGHNALLPAFVKGFWMVKGPMTGHEVIWADLLLQLWNIESNS